MTESTQNERRLIIKQMELAGIPNALQLWREIEKEFSSYPNTSRSKTSGTQHQRLNLI